MLSDHVNRINYSGTVAMLGLVRCKIVKHVKLYFILIRF